MATAIQTLWDGLRLAVLLPAQRQRIATRASGFWMAALLSVIADALLNFALVTAPRAFYPDGLGQSALEIVKPLLIAWGLTLLAQRPALLWTLATWLLTASTVIRVVVAVVIAQHPEFDHSRMYFNEPEFAPAYGIWMALIGFRLWKLLEPRWPKWRRFIPTAVAAFALALAYRVLPYQPAYFYGMDPYDADAEAAMESPSWPEDIHAETLFVEQSARLDQALQALQPQRPGKVDLYLLAVGGYASENVFRNEVQYVQSLFDQRFDTQGRSLVLLNHFDTLDKTPLATQRNIDRALAGIAERIDVDEDIVFLFVTTHGSAEHELSIELAGMPMQQLTPDSLSDAIRNAGIRWRVAVVSACYSGGFIDALSSSTALVLTAARSDRTSFGCGADSDITYFGRAYFAEALNQTGDFISAFEIAKSAIALREESLDDPPSEPQIASTPLIKAKLAEWQAQVQLGPVREFSVRR